ncbi:MAG: hypothetical protein VKI83_03520 [Synechococcaceae cyanobacterium]|nr:hypothetical protein [Synechococcaceae cyanobacterium]
MRRSNLEHLVTLPWLAAALVMLVMTRIRGESAETKLGLVGSSAICFSIGCLARTSLRLQEQVGRPAPPPADPHA